MVDATEAERCKVADFAPGPAARAGLAVCDITAYSTKATPPARGWGALQRPVTPRRRGLHGTRQITEQSPPRCRPVVFYSVDILSSTVRWSALDHLQSAVLRLIHRKARSVVAVHDLSTPAN